MSLPSIGPIQTVRAFPPTFSVGDEDASERRILIVDDEVSVRRMFAQWLGESWECATAASADEALERLSKNAYALVISDLMMPGRNGVELLR